MHQISSWKASSLSLAGCLTLCKSIVSTIPTYAMQTSLLLKKVCDTMDSLCRRFLWGAVDNNHKVHLVAWNKVCHQKTSSGLGLRYAKDVNLAFLSTLGWGLIHNHDELWVQVLRNHCKCGDDLIPRIYYGQNSSNLLKEIRSAWPIVEQNLGWKLRKGNSISLWDDR